MKALNYTRLNDETEAAFSSDSPANSEEFNSLYREWRGNEKNPFTFKGKRSQKLHTYVDGVGLQEKTAEKREWYAFRNICLLLTGIMFAYALAENVLILPVIALLKTFGVDISYSFHENTAYGNHHAVLFVFAVEEIMKLMLPAFLAWRTLKVPAKVACPLKPGRPWALFSALSTSCLGFVIASIIRIILPANIFSANNMNMIYKIAQNMEPVCKTVFVLFELIAVPVMMEFLFHGAVFQSVRQFGVSFAVILTALMNTAVMHNPFSAALVFVTSVIAGYGVWQSGSIVTGILVHIKARSLSYLLFWSMNMPSISGINAEFMLIAIVLAIGLFGGLLLSGSKNRLYTMKDYETFIPIKKKIKYIFIDSSFVAVWILYIVLVLVEVFV
ncbi:MAG: lysostaphin resistance A-like protein [Ruminococcus sp.]